MSLTDPSRFSLVPAPENLDAEEADPPNPKARAPCRSCADAACGMAWCGSGSTARESDPQARQGERTRALRPRSPSPY
jgi:hypothetical protein